MEVNSTSGASAQEIRFAVRGDNLMTCRPGAGMAGVDILSGSFVREFMREFGPCRVDYDVCPQSGVRVVAGAINRGETFDVMCVGVRLTELLVPDQVIGLGAERREVVVDSYPAFLDADLIFLAAAIKNRCRKSLVLVGGPACVWKFPYRWGEFAVRAVEKLQAEGLQVVALLDANEDMKQMKLSFEQSVPWANDENMRVNFSKAWVRWLHTAFKAENVSSLQEWLAVADIKQLCNSSDASQGGTARNRSRSRSPGGRAKAPAGAKKPAPGSLAALLGGL